MFILKKEFRSLTLVYPKEGGAEAEDARLVEPFGGACDHRDQRRQFGDELVHSVPTVLLRLVPQVPVRTGNKKTHH